MRKSILFSLAACLLTLVIAMPSNVAAVTGSEFQAGRITDDATFFNGYGMGLTEIQAFLNSKVPNCDTSGSQSYAGTTRAAYGTARGYPPPYTCLKDYRQDTQAKTVESGLCNGLAPANRSAAEIIYEVGISCGINQRTLIVLLEKEQSLVTDTWPFSIQYRSATGYGCPDTAPCDAEYYGFFNQVYSAARQFKRYARDASLFRYRAFRDNYIQYSPNASCGGTNVYIQNQATAGLYNYTPYQPNASALANLYGSGDACGAYGNRNYWRIYNDWFGSTYLPLLDCNSKVQGVSCVWSLMKNDGTQFLTSSKPERDHAINSFGWTYEGIVFYASQSQQQGTIPAYRLRRDNLHHYTVDQAEYTTLKNSGNWIDEGVAFHVYPSATSTNMSHRTYSLYNPSLNRRYWTMDENKKTSLINIGYSQVQNSFNSFSGHANVPLVANGRVNIYRLQAMGRYFYTSSLHELESVMRAGYVYEGLLTTANAAGSGTPVYRLQRNSAYFYTSNLNERNIAIQNYGMSNEGIAFYLDENSEQVYRVANSIGDRYLYTSNMNEVMSVANTNSWLYEGMLFSRAIDPSPIYRFLNLFNGRHFYTANFNEAARIVNKGWMYETVAFSANTSSGLPVYRLLLKDKHFYTANAHEKDIAVNVFGYVYEGVAFYVSQTPTSKPAYRLQGGSDEYFYTASSFEKDRAVSRYGYQYEGEAFYLP